MKKTLVKGSKAAKDFMAKLRAKKGAVKKTIKRVAKNAKQSFKDGYYAKDKLGSVALTKKGKPRKYLDKYQKEYNKMIDDYKYFVVHNNKVVEGNEYKSDAIDAANEYYPKAKVYTKLGLKKLGIPNNLHTNKYTLGSTLLINKGENPRAKPTRVIQVDRTKKGAFKKFKRISGVTKKHTDTKSHNVNIDIVSGVKKVDKFSLQQISNLLNEIVLMENYLQGEKNKLKTSKTSEGKTFFRNNVKNVKLKISNLKKQLTLVKRNIK